MSSENPYQSPQGDSTPKSPLLATRPKEFPTWRFAILAAVCLPGFYFAARLLSGSPWSRSQPGVHVVYGLALLLYLSMCGIILFGWRYPPKVERGANRSSPRSAALLAFAIVVLSLFAIPSAFLTICTPSTEAIVSMTARRGFYYEDLAFIGISLIAALSFSGIAIHLTRGLWFDAFGRPQAPPEVKIERPLPRIQPRKPPGDR